MAYCNKCGKSFCEHRVIVVQNREAPEQAKELVFVVAEEEQPKDKGDLHLVCVKEKEKSKSHQLVFPKHESSSSGNVLTVQSGFELKLTKEFFDRCQKRGTVFNISFLTGSGQRLAMKWVKGSHDCNFNGHIRELITASETTGKIISSFSDYVDMRSWKIRVVKTLLMDCGQKQIGIEPYIEDPDKFSSNTFWETENSRSYDKLVIALIHYSYLCSGGRFVLANLRGDVDENNKVITLLPPTLASGNAGGHGCQDLGNVHAFENHHTCNSICRDFPNLNHKEDAPDDGNKPVWVFKVVEE